MDFYMARIIKTKLKSTNLSLGIASNNDVDGISKSIAIFNLKRFPKMHFTRLYFSRLFLALLLLFCASCLYLYIFKNYNDQSPPAYFPNTMFQFPSNYNHSFANLKRKVVIGTVCCGTDRNGQMPLEETKVLIKSVIISAFLYNVTHIEIHLLLEYKKDMKYFLDNFEKFGLEKKGIKVSLHFSSAIDPIPEKYRPQMIYHKWFRCGHSRLLFTKALPEVDSIIYFDTDSIVTGSIWDLWAQFRNMEADSFKMIGVVANNERKPIEPKSTTEKCFTGLPYVKPEGVNSGLILMNLTRLRNYNWESKLFNVWDSYVPTKTKRIDDQNLLNILLHNNKSIMYQIPCQFNVRCTGCNHAMICDNVLNDPVGVQSVHGAAAQFDVGKRFEYIYHQYAKFDMENGDIIKDLMEPIRISKEPASKWVHCNEQINPHLFKNYF